MVQGLADEVLRRLALRRRKMNATIDFSPLLIHDNCIDSQAVGRSWIGSRIKKGTLLGYWRRHSS